MNFLSSSVNQESVKYGLYNQGATCYLNSVLQVLYMTEDFRSAVKRSTRENPNSEHIDLHLQTLFDNLKEKTGETFGVTRRLGVHRVTEQQDAAEYFEKILRLTSPTASGIFHGELTHKITCSCCGTEMATDEAFWHLPIALVDSDREHYSVVAGIKNYFRTSDLSGENQMYCEICDNKKDATATCVMKHHPEVLMLLLKRFEFDYRWMTNVKINCPVDIACTLQIPENQVYELYAVVDHFGDLRSGHYSAMIKDENGWYKYDDSMVAPLEKPLQEENFKISKTAYLLFYRKQNERRKTEDSAVAEGAEDSTALPAPQREQDAPEDTQKSHLGDDSEGVDQVRQDENEDFTGKHNVEQDHGHLPISVDEHGGNGVKEVESTGQEDFQPKQCPEGDTVTVEGRQSPNYLIGKLIDEVTDISSGDKIVAITYKIVKRKSTSPQPGPQDINIEALKLELLKSLRHDIFKTELRAAVGDDLFKIRTDLPSVKRQLTADVTQSYCGGKESLSACTDDNVELKIKFERLAAEFSNLESKCEDLESRSRRNNIKIVGVPEETVANTVAVATLLKNRC